MKKEKNKSLRRDKERFKRKMKKRQKIADLLWSILQNSHSCVKVVLPKLAQLIHSQIDSLSSSWEDVVLKRCWSVVSVHHMARLVVKVTNPLGKLKTKIT